MRLVRRITISVERRASVMRMLSTVVYQMQNFKLLVLVQQILQLQYTGSELMAEVPR